MSYSIVLIILGFILIFAVVLWIIDERGKFTQPSTLNFIKGGGWKHLLNLKTLYS